MFIIIQNECIDTSIFTQMKLYADAGVISFIYQNPIDEKEIELPVTFDDNYEAEVTFDEIENRFECEEEAYVVPYYASVPSGLLAKIKRRKDITQVPFKTYDFYTCHNEHDN